MPVEVGATRPSPLHRFGAVLARHAKVVLLVAAVLLVGAGALGTKAFAELQSGGFEDPGAESTTAGALLREHFAPDPNLVLIATATDGDLDAPAALAAGRTLTARLAGTADVKIVGSYFATPLPALRSKDGRSGLILAVVSGSQGHAVSIGEDISGQYMGTRDGLDIKVGGPVGVFGDINGQVKSSLTLAESIAVPITLLLLLWVFGSLVAALLPLLIGAFAIVGTFAELAVLGSLTDVSVFAINLTTALGLGLGIDYGLLIVARFREELHQGKDVPDAVAITVATAGRTILFSGAAVVAALATLTLFPLYFLSSFGYAGIGVVVIAAVAALVVTPAALALLGHRVEKGRVPLTGRNRGSQSAFWGRVAAAVYRRPVLCAAPVLAGLLLAASPLLGVHFALPDETVLRPDAPSRQVATVLAEQFPSQSTSVLSVVTDHPVSADQARSAARAVAAVPGVSAVDTASGVVTASGVGPATPDAAGLATADSQRLRVHTDFEAGSAKAQDLVSGVRAALPPGFLVGGSDASLHDTLVAIARPLPLVLLIIVLTTFVILFLFTGSLLQPLRALVVNGLSLTAAVGIVTWIFADGHLISLFGATPRPMDASMTVLLLCITFGLSMDYEVFLSSRITELHHAGADLRTAVTTGLARTGRIVTSAALLLSVSFFAFATSTVSMLQLFGFGAGVAVLIDATLVRGILVPAVMRLLGRANFWAPGPLRRLHARIGLREE